MVEHQHEDPTRDARRIKLLPHKFLPQKHETSVWVDANLILTASDLPALVEENSGTLLTTFRHSRRSTIAEEAATIIDFPEVVRTQQERYAGENYPDSKIPLPETGFMLRRTYDPRVQRFNEK